MLIAIKWHDTRSQDEKIWEKLSKLLSASKGRHGKDMIVVILWKIKRERESSTDHLVGTMVY
ncbi:hypothetical protein [Candidatus Williamhamiltonella defendens]|uniref:hypothetical protein n=1 Tax=Candidatus Williamhamiltonella defendens TaxID=138072 RepID=UPI00130E5D7E|nr:hypothetical protein [Candidatus Hamiltonella defensa]